MLALNRLAEEEHHMQAEQQESQSASAPDPVLGLGLPCVRANWCGILDKQKRHMYVLL